MEYFCSQLIRLATFVNRSFKNAKKKVSQTNRRTLRLRDWIGQVVRCSENFPVICLILWVWRWTYQYLPWPWQLQRLENLPGNVISTWHLLVDRLTFPGCNVSYAINIKWNPHSVQAVMGWFTTENRPIVHICTVPEVINRIHLGLTNKKGRQSPSPLVQ